MEESSGQPITLLDELDRRQNDVISRLDALNEQIEETLKTWTEQREPTESVGAQSPPSHAV